MATFELEESTFAGYMEDQSIWLAEVVAVKVVEKSYTDDDGNKVKKVEFKFKVIDESEDGQFDGTNVWGETPTRFNSHPDCKLRNWSAAILGQELPVGYRLDTDVLQGNRCRIVVELYEYEDKKSARDPDTGQYPMKQRNRVIDVLPTREKMAALAAAGVAEEPF